MRGHVGWEMVTIFTFPLTPLFRAGAEDEPSVLLALPWEVWGEAKPALAFLRVGAFCPGLLDLGLRLPLGRWGRPPALGVLVNAFTGLSSIVAKVVAMMKR